MKNDIKKREQELLHQIADLKQQLSLAEGYRSEAEAAKNEICKLQRTIVDNKKGLIQEYAKHISVLKELRMSELIVERSPVILFRRTADSDQRLEYISKNIKQFGYSAKEFLDGEIDFKGIIHPDDQERVRNEISSYADADVEKYTMIYRCITRSGDIRWVVDQTSVVRDAAGNKTHNQGVVFDITERKNAEDALRLSEEKFRRIVGNAVQGMYQSNLGGRILKINPAFAKMFGYGDTVQFFNKINDITVLYKDRESRKQFISTLKKDQIVTNYEMEMLDKDGKPVWVMINARLASDENGQAIIDGILIDNTKKRLAEDKLRRSRERFKHLANHDNLTGLFNTRYLYKKLDKLIIESDQTNEPFSLVFLDMDNFKQIVDTYGHLNGSQALKEVAVTLKASLIKPAFGVAYGGDEFVLVLPQTGKEEAFEHVQKIRLLMKETVYLTKNELEVRMSASFGVATYPNDAKTSEGLLALADEAMFNIKSSGKDAVGVSN